MMRTLSAIYAGLCIILVCILVAACGGASAAGPFAPLVGASPGHNNVTLRDTSQATGGEPGYVNSATTTRTIAGAEVTAFEWANLSILDNYASKGENVATYSQANKWGSGPTWAAVSEVADRSGSSSGLVAHEFDVWTSGPDTGNRIGLDVVLGDIKVMRGLGVSDQVEGTAALRIGTALTGKWNTGVQLTGRYGVGLDTSKANTAIGLRLKAGQIIELSPGVTLQSNGQQIIFTRAGQTVAIL